MPSHPTRTVTLLFTDLEGSSEYSEKFGALFESVRTQHFAVLRAAAERWQGFEVETAGDALFLVFQEASDAVQFAVEAQLQMACHPWPPEFGTLKVRIGMHTGQPFIGEDNGRPTFRGPATNRAARVQSAGHGGQILLSHATAQNINGLLPPEISLRDCGAHRLKGVGEERLWQVLHPELRADFPPLSTLNPQRHNLPVPPASLIGRDSEIEACRAALCASPTRLLTITGFGGLGKSRLALQVAELCVPEFNDGVWWVALDETRHADALMRAIALALRFEPQPTEPLETQVHNYLRNRRLLLVLDNTEQIEEAPRAIAKLLSAAPELKCLVATRRALELQLETLREVPPLPPAESMRLFAERAAARRADFAVTPDNTAAVAEICQRLEGVPLAVELAASRIANLSPHEVLRHLNQRFKVLQSRAPDVPPRQRALRGAIDWSHDLLGEEDRQLFAQLAVFHRGFTLEDAESVCDSFDVFDGVQELRGQSLLRVETLGEKSRFSMLESVREYAMEKLEALPELCETTRQRHIKHFLHFAEAQIAALRTHEETAALARFESHLDNVRAACNTARQLGNHEAGARLALALGMFYERRSLLNDAVRAIEVGLEIVPEPSPARWPLWRERAGLHFDKFENHAVRTCLSNAPLRGDENPRARGEVHNLLGLVAKRERDYEAARRAFHAAIEEFNVATHKPGTALAQCNLAATECEDPQGDKAAAARLLLEALSQHQQRGDLRGMAEALNNLGVLAQKDNNFDDAAVFYKDSLAAELQLRNIIGAARALYNLGEIAEAQRRFTSAWRLCAASDLLFAEAGSPLQRYATELREKVKAQAHTSPLPDAAAPLSEIAQWAQESG